MMLPTRLELLRLYANFYHTMGLNVTCISNEKNTYNEEDNNLLKAPNHSWSHLIKKRQELTELRSYSWYKATGLGFVTGSYGSQNVAAIDIDGREDKELLEILLYKVLDILRLPYDYDWIVRSGSGYGYHIIFIWSENNNDGGLPLQVSIPYKVVCLLPNFKYYDYFKQIELQFEGHMVLPPSIHPSYNFYSFKNNRLPEKELNFVSNDAFQQLSVQLCAKSFYRFVQGSSGYYEELLHEDTILKSLQGGRTLGDFTPTPPFILILDVETNGLPIKYDVPLTDFSNWPRIIEIAWTVFDSQHNIIISKHFFINPEGYEIADECIKLTQREKRIKERNVETIRNVLKDIKRWVEKINYLVGHNIEYDISCLLSECYRNDVSIDFSKENLICTMKESTNYCKIQSNHGYKYPKLEELYFKLFEKKPIEVHGADSDVMTTAKCFWALEEKGIITFE